MAIVDDRGRLGGRLNLVDAIVALVIVVLIPMAYGAYLLFQTPQPKLLGIEPARLYPGPNLRIAINGQNLRPFMRVSFDTVQGRTFQIGSTKSASVDLPDLAPGTYDVVLYDYMQEVARLPKALTILPQAAVSILDMQVAGSFKQLSDAQASELKSGTGFPSTGPIAEIVSVGSKVPGQLRVRAGDVTLGVPTDQTDLPATLKLKCWLATNPDGSVRCMMSGPVQPAAVAPDSVLTLAGPSGLVNFQISEVHLASSPQTVQARVRFIVTSELLAAMKAGDVDTSPNARAEAHGATLLALGAARAVSAAEAGARMPLGGGARVVDATVQVPLEPTGGGWTYKDQPFKTGAPFTFETSRYIVQGEVSDAMLSSLSPKEPAGR
ncbi:MAG: hypothetical protein ABJA98_29660 [Acidobacteriota bacterium]